jgi:hypothetical protein
LIWARSSYLLGRNRLLASLPQLLNGLLVVTQILLASDEDDRQTLAEVQNLGDPLYKGACVSDGSRLLMSIRATGRRDMQRETYLLLNVVEGVRRVDSEADQNDMRVGVRERAKTVVILLTSSIP